jgi:ATP-dependent Clp protease ATP-binding subunit ClpA
MPYPMLHRCSMFERFTDRARRSIVLAQEEARRLQHNYIGTEHVLLGLLAEETGVAAKAAKGFGLTLPVGREDVLSSAAGRGRAPATSPSRRARRSAWNSRSGRRCNLATTTSAPSMFCWALSARAKVSALRS